MSSIDQTPRALVRQSPTPEQEAQPTDISFAGTARAIALGFIAVVAGGSSLEAHGPTAPTPLVERELDPRGQTLKLMEKRVSLQTAGSSLESILDAIATLSGVKIEGLWSSVGGDGGLVRDQELAMTLTNVTVRAALDKLAERLESASSGGPTTWQVLSDGRLQFGTKARLDRYQELRSYDLRDVAGDTPQFLGAPKFNFNAALEQGRGNGGSIIGESQAGERRRSSKGDELEKMRELLLDTVESEQWVERGGSGGTIRIYNGTMLVRAAPYVHRALGGIS